ncbi:MAG TPA: hypothetical protein ENF37_03355 [Beggiatoa sp.]|nr:MAG: hypothetical protein DRQ99_16415 [Gammaproteobacteria bacterium]HEW97667.1 hypothetical protein [Beggiatoa sp.]
MWLIPLLIIKGEFFRAHFENVICEHCNQRNGDSALIDTTIYGKAEKFLEESLKLEVKRCIHCGEKLHRRQTIWLANEKK